MTAGHDKLRIVVLGYVVRGPVGGMAWHHLNYVRGLAELGHDVLFVEDSDDYPSCYDPTRFVTDCDPGYGLQFAAAAFKGIGHADGWCYHDAHTGRWHGPAAGRALSFCRSADLVLNVSGVNPLRDWTARVPLRAYIDTDPLFTQARHLDDPAAMARAAAHNLHFTFGELIPAGQSAAPADGFAWQPTRQPVALSCWPVRPLAPRGAFTTVMQWDSYATRTVEGTEFGMKSASFAGYEDLPGRVSANMALALGGEGAPQDMLAARGWRIDDPLAATRTIDSYRDYLAAAKGEWSVAKHGYVAGHTGWFSERSACFLASGRPVVVQDTGCSQVLEAEAGLSFFRSPDEAVEAMQAVEADYARHAAAARDVAERYFDSARVLAKLLDRCTVPAAGRVAA